MNPDPTDGDPSAAGVRLWLDDVRPAPPGWTRVLTPEGAIALLQAGRVAEMSLDHDLGLGEDRTGYAVVAWLEEAVATRGFVPPPRIAVHSANPVGRQRMERAIESIMARR